MACPCFSALLSMDFEPTVSRIVGQCGSNTSGSTHDIFTSNSLYPLAILHSEINCKYLVLLKHTETVKTINSKARSRKAWIKSVEESNQHDLQKRNALRFFFHFDRAIEEIHSHIVYLLLISVFQRAGVSIEGDIISCPQQLHTFSSTPFSIATRQPNQPPLHMWNETTKECSMSESWGEMLRFIFAIFERPRNWSKLSKPNF